MERAGISREVAKKISGNKTDWAYIRYNIVSGRDIEDAGKKLTEFLNSMIYGPNGSLANSLT
jgi:hypothetical protein